MKVSLIFGTRPEAVKLAPLVVAMREHPELTCSVCVTSQHREMLTQILDTFGIVPDADLDVMQPNQTLPRLTARVLEKVDAYLEEEKPDLVIVQGDTTTVLATVLAAFYQRIPVGHVEAGMRSWDLMAPWPEEANRVMVAPLVTLHFVPIASNRDHLLKENIPDRWIYVTGNPVIDALMLTVEKVKKKPPTIPNLDPAVMEDDGKRLVLITGHRRESFGPGFESICKAIAALADRFQDTHFVYPVHLNPNVQEPVDRILRANEEGTARTNLHLIPPLSYMPFVALLHRADIVLTDSGGVQEESACLGKPTLVMRDTTERPEAVASGTVKLVGNRYNSIVDSVTQLLVHDDVFEQMAQPFSMYAEGQSTQRIVEACLEWGREAGLITGDEG
ncbi:MAG: UDP-N-acetylglucosamine 2-epimerase (non-hydrolyzing) [Deltaproteobacteria bacterium]|nr:MAG: UDP-N-acetylglucosamine 2-epimerase (non-hydrolyzing) [Deltaproteobacteria bacterium]